MGLVTREILKEFAPRARRSAELLRELDSALPRYDINTVDRVACFMAQCGHESGGFQHLEENLNYSAAGLDRTFHKYFSGAGRDPYEYSRQPEKIANVVYANRMGNGDEDSGDGWKFRGRGYIQLTGKNNYQEFADYMEMDLDDVVEFVGTVPGAVESACWFWDKHHLNFYADQRDMRKITYIVNGGYNHLESRIMLYEQMMDLLISEDETGSEIPGKGRIDVELMYGDRGKEIENLQRALGVKIDGVFGRETRRYLKRFQRSNGLVPDGIASKLTLTKLYTGM